VQERLQKVLARAGFASRRGAERLMLEGRVTVNGAIVKELGTKADLETDDVRVDGVRVKPQKAAVYLVLNKPKGVVTTRSDPERRPTVMELVPQVAGLFPVGRLDVTTEGLILLTNDGAFAERVAHPRYEVPRVYHAKVHGVPGAETLERLRRGVKVEGDFMAVDRARVIDADNNAWVEVTLHEGKQHEVKRLLEEVGHPVSKLRRVAIGPVTSRGLEPGQFRALSPAEVEGLQRGRDASSGELGRLSRRRPRPRARPRPSPRPTTPQGSRPHTRRDEPRGQASGRRPERRRAGTRSGRR
jgi:23S rRNA pseudouridine2605 synthase